MQLKVLEVTENGEWDLSSLPALLRGARLLAIEQVSNLLGIVNPLQEVVQMAHAAGCAVAVDGAQGVMHGPLDVTALDVDFYAFSGHKVYGPTGIGVLYGKPCYLERMPPWQGGGDMIASVSLEAGTRYAALPLKYEAGTANYIGAVGLGEAIAFLEETDPVFLREHEKDLSQYGMEKLLAVEGLHLYGTSVRYPRIPLFTFNVEGVHSQDLAILLDQAGIAVRSGQMCAEPLLARYGQTAALRASLALYSTRDEIDYLIDRLKWAIALLK